MYSHWLPTINCNATRNSDLVAHFFRRSFDLLGDGGAFGLIATNTIGQGDTRESGLRYILVDATGTVFRARRRVKWPGTAAVIVSTVHVGRGDFDWPSPTLDGRVVSRISAFLREGADDETPARLQNNAGKAFIGTIILGVGFTFDDLNAEKGECEPLSKMDEVLEANRNNGERIRPYLGGEEVNNDPKHKHRRYAIDFEDFPLSRDPTLPKWANASDSQKKAMLNNGVVSADYQGPVAADWPDLLEIVEKWVKPQRVGLKRENYRKKWWVYGERVQALYAAIESFDEVLVIGSKALTHFAYALVPANQILSQNINIFALDREFFAVLSSRIHETWARVLGSSIKDDFTYSVLDVFGTFPLPTCSEQNFADISRRYLSHRATLMVANQQGLTATYNRFHNPLDNEDDIVTLRRLHAEMDDAVLRAYGWNDLADLCAPGAEFAPRFLTEDDEPEFAYQDRLFWPAPFRDKVLAHLLALNKERAAAEQRAGKIRKAPSRTAPEEEEGTLV
jgi:hypothetical protein